MKWQGSWWGIEIQAEDEEDEKLLRALHDRLPKQAEHSYDAGILKVVTDPEDVDQAHPCFEDFSNFTLRFER